MENKIPIYRQIEQYIMNNIEDGIYAEGMMIPSEEDFCEKFHTSRMTVRKAFDILQTKGILHKKKGKGTFVSTFSIEKNMQTIHGWKETMQMAGYRTRSDLLKIAMEKADEKIAKNCI
ncbi:GntR family transcriptional regulator [[Clostridium] innocuum]|nr:GntR family transcriptional regulator [[Clostridium] innocuum]